MVSTFDHKRYSDKGGHLHSPLMVNSNQPSRFANFTTEKSMSRQPSAYSAGKIVNNNSNKHFYILTNTRYLVPTNLCYDGYKRQRLRRQP